MLNKILILFIVSLSLTSCSRKKNFDFFRAELFNALIASSQIELVELERANSNLAIVRPPLTWVPLLKSTVEGKRGKGAFCLFFRTPHREQQGILKLVELDFTKQCSSVLDPGGEISRAQLEGVSNLLFFTGKGESRGMELSFTFEQQNKGQKILIPLYNVTRREPLVRFSSTTEVSRIPGVRIATELPQANKKLFMGESLLDQEGGEPIACHRVNSNCKTVEPNICNRCRFGWFPGASGISCNQGGTKYCRPNRCGEKSMPACPRGIDHRRYKIEDVCIEDSPAAFCRDGLRVVCNDKKELICL